MVDLGPRRLSKPRTNKSSVNIVTASEQPVETPSPHSSSDRDYFGEHAVIVTSQGERRSRSKSRSRIRAYLYTSNRGSVQDSSDEGDGQNSLAGAARDVRKRLSRTSSSIVQSARASTTLLPHLDSHCSDPEETAMMADQIKERAYRDSLAAQNHVSSPVDEQKHVDSVMAPLRRKSLYTPGLATRDTGDILRKPPSSPSQADRENYFNPASPQTSPLSQLAASNPGDDGRSTPSNIHYPQLGGLQLGTLRVTNGSASPKSGDQPSDLACRSTTPESRTYYTASEGSFFGDPWSPLPLRSGSPLRFESKQEASIRSSGDGKSTRHESLPFNNETPHRASAMAHEYMSEIGASPLSYSETTMSKEVPLDKDDAEEDEGIVMPQLQHPAAQMWRSVISDAEQMHALTGNQEDAYCKLQRDVPTVSDSQCLSIPGSLASGSNVCIGMPTTDSGYSSNTSLNMCDATGPISNKIIKPVDLSTDFGTGRYRCISGPREMPQPVPNQLTSISPLPCSSDSTPNAQSTPSYQAGTTIRPSARVSTQNLVRKLQKPRPKSQPPPVNFITVQGYRELTKAHIPRVPSIVAARHAARLSRFPLLDHTFPSSQHTTVKDYASPRQHHVPFRFPSPANSLEAASISSMKAPAMRAEAQEPKGSFPNHANDLIATKDQWPASSNILSDAKSDTRVTSPTQEFIPDKIQDEWTTSGIIRSPSWSDFRGGRKKKEQKKLLREEKEASKRLVKEEKELERRLQKDRKDLERPAKREDHCQKSPHTRSASRARSSKRRSSENDEVAKIADFGTVAQSLGGSPYDVATSMFPTPNASKDLSHWYPHQISTALPNSRSMIGVEETAAACLTRASTKGLNRSQSFGRASFPFAEHEFGVREPVIGKRGRPQTTFVGAPAIPAVAAIDLRVHGLEWTHNRQRSQNFSAAKKPTPDVLRWPMRPRSVMESAPPVPALPSAQDIRQREAQITRSRPHSIIIDGPSIPTVNTEQKTTARDLVPNLWSNGSLEKKSHRTIEKQRQLINEVAPVDNNDVREAQHNEPNQDKFNVKGRHIMDSSPLNKRNSRPSSTARAFNAGSQDMARAKQTPKPMQSHQGDLPPPPASQPQSSVSWHDLQLVTEQGQYHRDLTPQSGPNPFDSMQQRTKSEPFQIPRKREGSSASTITATALPCVKTSGRYENSLSSEYEPGRGIGGSAGTKSITTGASRKSVDFSKRFGLDLCDVPILVART